MYCGWINKFFCTYIYVMGLNNRNSFLVQLLHMRTNVAFPDIIEILDLLPECMAETFMDAAPEEGKKVFLGVVSALWKNTIYGPAVYMKPPLDFDNSFVDLKLAGETQFAREMWSRMHPRLRDRVLARHAKGPRPNNHMSKAYKERDRTETEYREKFIALEKERKKRKAKTLEKVEKIKKRIKAKEDQEKNL